MVEVVTDPGEGDPEGQGDHPELYERPENLCGGLDDPHEQSTDLDSSVAKPDTGVVSHREVGQSGLHKEEVEQRKNLHGQKLAVLSIFQI